MRNNTGKFGITLEISRCALPGERLAFGGTKNADGGTKIDPLCTGTKSPRVTPRIPTISLSGSPLAQTLPGGEAAGG